MKKVVMKVDIHDDKMKQKVLKSVSTLPGIDSIGADMKEGKLTVIGSVDPIQIVAKLKKYCHNEILTVGPAVDPKKGGGDEKKGDSAKKEGDKKKESNDDEQQDFQYYYHSYPYMAAQPVYNHPYHQNYDYRVVSPDENPNAACVIC